MPPDPNPPQMQSLCPRPSVGAFPQSLAVGFGVWQRFFEGQLCITRDLMQTSLLPQKSQVAEGL